MTQQTTRFECLIHYIKTHKTKSILIGVGMFLLLLYVVVFFIPRPVQFSYAGESCVRQLTLFPALHRAADETQLKVHFGDEAKLGSLAVASLKTCFTPASEPRQGELTVATAPFGSVIARKQFTVKIPEAPKVNAAALGQPLAVSKPLQLPLSQPDGVFRYSLEAAGQTAECQAEGQQLSCDMPALELKQSEAYSLVLTRQFGQGTKTTLVKQDIKTLRALKIKEASLKSGQTVYHKPKSFTFTADKELGRAVATLKTTGKQPKEVAVKAELSGKTLKVVLVKELPREKEYQLTIRELEARDGSTLVEPKKLKFRTSGGPKVVGINIGTSQVSGSAVAVVQFDQKLGSDAAMYISMAGGKAAITKGATSVSIALQNLPKCQAFTIAVKPGLKSKYGIKSQQSWAHKSRTTCHSVHTYGTSLQGRPLQAYVFGSSGPVTMYVGAIHGNEPSSSGLMQAWVEELERNAGKIGKRRIVVVPTINPDGVAANSRNNSRNVNLSRNFPTDNWVRDINDTNGKVKGGGGKKPLSEPEAKALANLTRQYRPRLLLSFHAIGSLVVGDPGGYSAGYARKYAQMVGYRDATGSSGTFDYDITGAYEDWAYRNEGIPSMVIELSSYTSYYIDHHRAALWAML